MRLDYLASGISLSLIRNLIVDQVSERVCSLAVQHAGNYLHRFLYGRQTLSITTSPFCVLLIEELIVLDTVQRPDFQRLDVVLVGRLSDDVLLFKRVDDAIDRVCFNLSGKSLTAAVLLSDDRAGPRGSAAVLYSDRGDQRILLLTDLCRC